MNRLRKIINFTFVCLFLIMAQSSNAQKENTISEITVTDDSGKSLTLKQPAQRAISLAPHLTEMMFYIGAQDKLVGRDSASDFPEAAKAITNIGDISLLNIEAILSLKPDLILAWKSGNTQRNLQRLQELGIPVYYSEPRKLEDIYHNMVSLAALTGSNKNHKKIEKFKLELQSISKTIKQKEKAVPVFYQVWHEPLVTLNGEHLLSHMIALCGGHNIFSSETVLAPQISIESVIEANPQLIITDSKDLGDIWKSWQSIDAVQYDNFLYINPDELRPGPRILQGFEKLCQAIENSP